ncbi:MAG: tetratricopeptide repeat protein [Candidatus Lokiarchaeota archaeon]|nr:tetratricopeptide repeat protein [Candidatus Lokiarchaeota archaeon]
MKKNKQSQKLEDIDTLIVNSFTLIKAREFDKGLSIANKILNEGGIQINLPQKFGARIARLVALMGLKQHNQVNEEIKLSEQIINQMNNVDRENFLVKDGIGRLYSIKGAIQSAQGELEDAILNYHHSIAIYETLNNKKSIFYQLEAIGWIKRAQGKLDEALNYFHKMLNLAKETRNEMYIASSKFSIAFANFYKGDLDQATEYAQECLALYEKLKRFRGLTAAYSIFGSIYRGKGEFDKSLEYYRKVLTIYNENLDIQKGVTHSYCYALRNIGWIYYDKNKIKKSIEYLREAVKAHKSLCEWNNTIFDYDLVMFNLLLILSAIEIDDNQQIENSMEQLSRFAQKWPWIDYFRKFGKALILKNKQRAKYRFQAQQIFEEILEVKFDYQIEFMIQVNLCDLLLEELKYSGDEEILLEIQGLLNRISDLANNQRSITTLVTLYSLQAKLALIEGNAELSNELLTKALTIAENKGLELISKKLKTQQNQLFNQLEEWKALFIQNSKLQEKIEILNLKEYVTEAISEVLEKKFKTEKKYNIFYKDLLKEYPKIQREECRVGIAQIGLSKTGDILDEFFELKGSGILALKENKIETIRSTVKNMIEKANSNGINILIFPEMTIDLNYDVFLEEISNLAKTYNMYIIPGSYHDQPTKRNLSLVIGPEGVIWEQEKHIPAIIHFGGKKFKETIDTSSLPRKTIVCNTKFGRVAILICRDFLDMDLRVELKNFEPPVDIIINPAFTPVTADFKAAHFDARRSIYGYCFFANVAEYGESHIYTPEKDRTERVIPAKEEGLIYKDIDLFKLRSERKKWTKEQKKEIQFIQSTR